ncbi:hypothetical protein HGRIS_000683 [Hohenbuehelia grisea]|uniref:Terpene synthase n=1 Tax=Hohenbuehelia grisea TaxID=104357 RepID=A0ABR3JRY0_9AGAR
MALHFQIPDFLSRCPFELRISPHCRQASNTSDAWLCRGANLSAEDARAVVGTKAGLLSAMCYPTVDSAQFRVCCDFVNLFFYFNVLLEDADVQGVAELADIVLNTIHHPQYISDSYVATLVRDLWTRLQKTCPSSVQRRLAASIEEMFQAFEQQVYNRLTNTYPDLESFISLRRETSACAPGFLLMEYAHSMRLPRDVIHHPILVHLTQLAVDLVSWSNDILSYNYDQARGSPHNIIAVVMLTKCLDIQHAINYVASLYRSTLDLFLHQLQGIPRWGGKIDADVETYVRGLQDWIIGSQQWCFETERYFGDDGDRVRNRRRVKLDVPQAFA